MHIPDLFLIFSVFLITACFLGILFALVGRRWKLLSRLCLGLILYISLYAILLISVSRVSPQKVLALRQLQCFDDWCASVEHVEQRPAIENVQAKGLFYLVTIRVTSQAKQISQRALDATVYLQDEQGMRYDISPQGQKALEAAGQAGQPLNSRVDAGGSFTYTAVFEVPANIIHPGIVISHGAFPGFLIIGDSQSFLHKPTVVRLPDNE